MSPFLFIFVCITMDQSVHRLGEKGCISCRLAPMIDTSVLCQSCHDGALGRAPMVIEVPKGHKSYKSGTFAAFLADGWDS